MVFRRETVIRDVSEGFTTIGWHGACLPPPLTSGSLFNQYLFALPCFFVVCFFFSFFLICRREDFTSPAAGTERVLSATSGTCVSVVRLAAICLFLAELYFGLWVCTLFWGHSPCSSNFPFLPRPHSDLILVLLLLVFIASFFGYGYSHLCAGSSARARLIHDVAAAAFVPFQGTLSHTCPESSSSLSSSVFLDVRHFFSQGRSWILALNCHLCHHYQHHRSWSLEDVILSDLLVSD